MFVDESEDDVRADDHVAALAEEGDPVTAQMALLWAALVAENAGDIDAAIRHARAGLAHPPLTPYLEASLQSQLAQLAMSRGDHRTAAEHAAVAWPILMRMHADDDARSMRALAAMNHLLEGRLDEAECEIEEIARSGAETKLGSQMVLLGARAELALARGRVADGLRLFDEALASVERVEGMDFGGPLSPWVMLAASASMVARLRFGTTAADAERADELFDMLVRESGTVVRGDLPYTDFPLNGVLLAALGTHRLTRGTPGAHADGVRLLALADRWAYNRSFPTMSWDALHGLAERTAPGLLDEVAGEYADRPPADLVEEARVLLARVATSSG
jgi:hypothetical protein